MTKRQIAREVLTAVGGAIVGIALMILLDEHDWPTFLAPYLLIQIVRCVIWAIKVLRGPR